MRGTRQNALSVESTPWRQLGPEVVFSSDGPKMQMTVVSSPLPITARSASCEQLNRLGAGLIRKPVVKTQLVPLRAAFGSAQNGAPGESATGLRHWPLESSTEPIGQCAEAAVGATKRMHSPETMPKTSP